MTSDMEGPVLTWYTDRDGHRRIHVPLTDRECDEAYAIGSRMEQEEKTRRLAEYESSPEQEDWDSDECDIPPNAGSAS